MRGDFGQPSAALGFATLALGSALGVVWLMGVVQTAAERLRPAVGDLVRVPEGSSTTDGRSSIVVEATLPSGSLCLIGTGRSADLGGGLFVTRRDPDGWLDVSWMSQGRSASKGPDCGRDTDLRMTESSFERLSLSLTGEDQPRGIVEANVGLQ